MGRAGGAPCEREPDRRHQRGPSRAGAARRRRGHHLSRRRRRRDVTWARCWSAAGKRRDQRRGRHRRPAANGREFEMIDRHRARIERIQRAAAANPRVTGLAGGLPAEAQFPKRAFADAFLRALSQSGTPALQYGWVEGSETLRSWIAEPPAHARSRDRRRRRHHHQRRAAGARHRAGIGRAPGRTHRRGPRDLSRRAGAHARPASGPGDVR